MFTGIVECMGRVRGIAREGELIRLELEAPEIAGEVALGDSVAVGGCCLTVTRFGNGRIAFDAVQETLARTALGALEPGSSVNLERAMRADARLDGHIVQGHVDGTGRVRELQRDGDDVRLWIDCEPEFAELLVEKGSVAIDGVSLTVVSAADDGFDVALIPHTLAVTTLGQLAPGAAVNLEADVLGKYVKKYLQRVFGPGAGAAAPARAPA